MEWTFSFPLMNSFNKTEAAIFSMQIMLPKDFSFSQIYNYVRLNMFHLADNNSGLHFRVTL